MFGSRRRESCICTYDQVGRTPSSVHPFICLSSTFLSTYLWNDSGYHHIDLFQCLHTERTHLQDVSTREIKSVFLYTHLRTKNFGVHANIMRISATPKIGTDSQLCVSVCVYVCGFVRVWFIIGRQSRKTVQSRQANRSKPELLYANSEKKITRTSASCTEQSKKNVYR